MASPPSMILHPRHGFTLMELIVVMALLAIVAGLVAPQLRGFVAGRSSEEECRRLASMIGHARDLAIGESTRVTFWIAEDGTEYGLRGNRSDFRALSCSTAAGTIVTPTEEDGTALDESTDLVFWPDGEIDLASPPAYSLEENGEVVYRLVLNDEGTRYEMSTP